MRRCFSLLLSAVLLATTVVALSATTAVAATPTYTKTPLWFRVDVGGRTCTIVADQYRPRAASASRPVPAI